MPARHHHRRVLIGGLFFGDGADEDGVEVVGGRERDLDLRVRVLLAELWLRTGARNGAYGKFVLGRPFCPFFFHDCLQF